MLRINLATGLAMVLVLVLCAAVLLPVAAPHLARCPAFLRRWARAVAGLGSRPRDRGQETDAADDADHAWHL